MGNYLLGREPRQILLLLILIGEDNGGTLLLALLCFPSHLRPHCPPQVQ